MDLCVDSTGMSSCNRLRLCQCWSMQSSTSDIKPVDTMILKEAVSGSLAWITSSNSLWKIWGCLEETFIANPQGARRDPSSLVLLFESFLPSQAFGSYVCDGGGC